jgi:hypothetical protein
VVRPDEFGKLFPEGLPEWIKKPVQEKSGDQDKPTPLKELLSLKKFTEEATEAVTPDIEIVGTLGMTQDERMYVFYKDDRQYIPSQEARPYDAVTSADEMSTLGSHPTMASLFIANKLWHVRGKVPPGTLIKVFVGHVGRTPYGARYFIADGYYSKQRIRHPNTPGLAITGKLRLILQNELSDYGIIPSPRSFEMEPIIEEVY